MGREKTNGRHADNGGDEVGDGFDELFREMSQELGTDWELAETVVADDSQDEVDTDDGEPEPMIMSVEFALERMVPTLDPESEPVMPGTHTTEQRALAYPTNATLVVQYQVEVATGEGTFVRTEATGTLASAQAYKLRIQDDFSFGFDARRNDYEIILNPNATDVELREIGGDEEFRLYYEGGQVLVDKPRGVRLDVYRITRMEDGQRSVTKLSESVPGSAENVLLPTDPTDRYSDFTEYMLGVGLAQLDKRCYAFSIYTAVKLARPEPGDEDD